MTALPARSLPDGQAKGWSGEGQAVTLVKDLNCIYGNTTSLLLSSCARDGAQRRPERFSMAGLQRKQGRAC